MRTTLKTLIRTQHKDLPIKNKRIYVDKKYKRAPKEIPIRIEYIEQLMGCATRDYLPKQEHKYVIGRTWTISN